MTSVDDLLNITAPWKADNFQTKRFGTRYYCDPLPTCEIAPATDKVWPGFSSLKPSKPFRKNVEWVSVDGEIGTRAVPLDLARAWVWLAQQPDIDVTSIAFRQAFYESARKQMDRDTFRGSCIHAYAEALMVGEQAPAWATDNDDARPYLTHVEDFISTHVARVVAIEAVVIDRTRGYGGTGDAWVELADGRIAYADWKSRGTDAKHAAYEEEIAQGGAYTSAEYMILPNAEQTEAVRAPMPAATVGLVVSIRPDGWEAYEYGLDEAAASFGHLMGAYHETSKSGKRARLAKSKRPILTPAVDLRAALQFRIDTIRMHDTDAVKRLAVRLQAADIPTLKQSDDHTPEQLEQMATLIAEIERDVLPFTSPPTPAVQPTEPPAAETVRFPRGMADEGGEVNAKDYDDLRALFDTLEGDRRSWVLERAREAKRAGVAVHMAEKASLRRWTINHALIAASAIGDDDVARELLAAVIEEDWPHMPTFNVGSCFGALTIPEAEQVASLAEAVATHIGNDRPLPLRPDTGRLDVAALRAA